MFVAQTLTVAIDRYPSIANQRFIRRNKKATFLPESFRRVPTRAAAPLIVGLDHGFAIERLPMLLPWECRDLRPVVGSAKTHNFAL